MTIEETDVATYSLNQSEALQCELKLIFNSFSIDFPSISHSMSFQSFLVIWKDIEAFSTLNALKQNFHQALSVDVHTWGSSEYRACWISSQSAFVAETLLCSLLFQCLQRNSICNCFSFSLTTWIMIMVKPQLTLNNEEDWFPLFGLRFVLARYFQYKLRVLQFHKKNLCGALERLRHGSSFLFFKLTSRARCGLWSN